MLLLVANMKDVPRSNKSPQNQLCAIQAISFLVLDYPALSVAFHKQGAGRYLAAVLPDVQRCRNGTRRLLHEATRRALACVDEVEVITLICRFEWEHRHEVIKAEKTAIELTSYAR